MGAQRAGEESVTDREPDSQLARRAQAGDGAALAAIYRRYAPLATATARRLLRDSADVEDVVQETFLIVFEQLGRLTEPAALRGWISRIAVSRAHRRFRAQRAASAVSHDDPQLVLDRQVSGDASPEHVAELSLIDRALHMPPGLRAPWVLRHVAGVALEDIAAMCACSLATVKRRLTEAEAIIADYVHANDGERQRRRFARGTLV